MLLLLIVGVMLPHSTSNNEAEHTESNFPTESDIQWMQTSYNNSDMFLRFGNEINGIMNGTQEMNAQRLIFCSGEVTGWARNAQKQSEDMEISPELKEAKTEYAEATGNYATMGDYINDGVLAVQRGNTEDGEKFLQTGLEHYQEAQIHYNNYLTIIRKYGVGN